MDGPHRSLEGRAHARNEWSAYKEATVSEVRNKPLLDNWERHKGDWRGMEGKGARVDKKQLFKDKEQQDVRSSVDAYPLTQHPGYLRNSILFDPVLIPRSLPAGSRRLNPWCYVSIPSVTSPQMGLSSFPCCPSSSAAFVSENPKREVVHYKIAVSLPRLCCAAAHLCCLPRSLYIFWFLCGPSLSHIIFEFILMKLAEPV